MGFTQYFMEEKGLRSPLLNIDHPDLAFISLCCRAPDHLSEAACTCVSHHSYPDWPFQAYLPFLDPQKPESSPVVPMTPWPLLSWYPLLHLLVSQCPASTTLLSPAILKLWTHRGCSETTEWCSPKVSTQRLLEVCLFPYYSRRVYLIQPMNKWAHWILKRILALVLSAASRLLTDWLIESLTAWTFEWNQWESYRFYQQEQAAAQVSHMKVQFTNT